MRALTQLSAVALTSALALSGCATAGHPGGYIDMYFDNGNPIYSPRKAELFDENGEALCNAPIYLNRLESRYRPFSDTGGLLNSFLWETSNPNIDPDTPIAQLEVPSGTTESAYRELLRRREGGLERMYELTHPLFDEKEGITGPEDMAAIREALADRFEMLANAEAPSARFVSAGSSWIETDKGRFNTRRPGDVELYMDTLGITNEEFLGLENDYLAASGEAGEYLVIIERASGEFRFVNGSGTLEVEHMEMFQEFGIMQKVGVTDSIATVITLVNDGCAADGDSPQARWWILDIQDVEPSAPANEDDEDEAAAEDATETVDADADSE